jgi:MFS family permease
MWKARNASPSSACSCTADVEAHPMHNDFRSGGSNRANRALDAANFFLADVRDGLGPYLAIYLLTVQKWDEAGIGIVMSIATVAGIVAQTPAGALVDAVGAKRVIVAAAAVVITAASLLLPWLADFRAVALSQATAHAAGAVLGPGLAAITLGMVGHKAFTRRIGRNESFNHAGNAFAAGVAGVAAYGLGPSAVFYLLAVHSMASVLSVLAIPARAIDRDLARGLHDALPAHDRGAADNNDTPTGFRTLITCRPLMIFAACALLFHTANAAMLPLVGQKLALQDENLGTSLMSACIVAAQVVMVPMALLVGAKADLWGRKPLFLAGFVILPIRGLLYTLSDDKFWLVGVQLLDGIGAGIYGAIFPIVVADLMRGTGRYSAALGAVSTAQGIGAALSTTLAGIVVVHAGYGAAFVTLAAVAAAGLLLFVLFMPETAPAVLPAVQATVDHGGDVAPAARMAAE